MLSRMPSMPFVVHQIDDQLELVQALEVRHLGRVAGVDQRFEARGHQRRGAAAEHGLFAEQIGFRLFAEVGFEDAGASAADAACVRQPRSLCALPDVS